jgi:hypothetical protein
MAQSWTVQISANGSPVTDAIVWFMQEKDVGGRNFPPRKDVLDPGFTPTHTHSSRGLYTTGDPTPADPKGPWRLIVLAKGKSPVIQPIQIVDGPAGKGFLTQPRNFDDPKASSVEAATVEIKSSGVGTNTTTTFHVKMFDQSEIVLLTGTQYSKAGAPLRRFAEGRRDVLYGAKKIDDGTIVTVFCLDERRVIHFFKGKGAANVWIIGHAVRKTGTPPAAITPGAPWPFVVDDKQRNVAIHPFELYKYLSDIGGDANLKGRVREVSIFSHAFSDGPILYNTSDVASNRPNPVARDPNDFDCRAKDFDVPNMSGYKDLVAAMGTGSRWHVWGCNTNPQLVMMTAGANQSLKRGEADTAFFTVTGKTFTGNFEARVNRRRVLELHLKWLAATTAGAERSFGGTAAARIGTDFFAPLPGTWSGFEPKAGTMFVVEKHATDPSFEVIKQYHETEPALKPKLKLTSGTDGVRYANYKSYVGTTPPTVAARSEQYKFVNFKRNDAKRCFIEFHGGKFHAIDGHSTVVSTLVSDAGSIAPSLAGKRAHHYLLQQTPDSGSAAVLAVEDGAIRVFKLQRGTSGKFDKLDGEI